MIPSRCIHILSFLNVLSHLSDGFVMMPASAPPGRAAVVSLRSGLLRLDRQPSHTPRLEEEVGYLGIRRSRRRKQVGLTLWHSSDQIDCATVDGGSEPRTDGDEMCFHDFRRIFDQIPLNYPVADIVRAPLTLTSSPLPARI